MSFEIDHYEPQSVRPDLKNRYDNLIYSCEWCNGLKRDLCPPPAARVDGNRFFRPDHDEYGHHFKIEGQRLREVTRIGWYTIEFLDLNRLSLRRIRDIRARLHKCDQMIVAGVRGLRGFNIDQIPPAIRAAVSTDIQRIASGVEFLASDIDTVLRRFARSPLLDDDPEAAKRAKKRKVEQADLELIYSGAWRSSVRR